MKALKNLVTVGLIAGIAATSAFSAPKQKTIKLGFNIPLTGDSPKVGESAKFAGEIIKNEINVSTHCLGVLTLIIIPHFS